MSLENLPMQAEAPIDSWEGVPDQRGPVIPSLPRGDYQFQLPHNLTPGSWKEDEEKKQDGSAPIMHYRLQFDADFPLMVTATNVPVEEHSLFRGSISTRGKRRWVGKKGDPPAIVSDALYLYKDALKGPKINPSDDKAVRDGISKIGAGKNFVARVIWETNCSDKKVRYVTGPDGGSVQDPEGKMGCKTYYKDGKTVDPTSGLIVDRFTCKCGAALRVFPELSNFRPAIEG